MATDGLTPEQRAAPIASAANECCYRSDGYEEDIAAQIAAAIRQAENDALERAAAYVEGEDCTGHETAMALYIRNLKHAEP